MIHRWNHEDWTEPLDLGAPITDGVVTKYVPQVAAMGAETVGFPLEEPKSFSYQKAANLLDKHSLQASIIAAMDESRDLLHDEAEVRANSRSYIRSCIDAAEAIGSDRVVGPLYSAVGRTWKMTSAAREVAIENAAEQLSELAEYADDRNVVLCVEPLNRFETSVVNTVEQALKMIEQVDHSACGLLLDTFHMNIEERSLPTAMRAANDQLMHFHACANDRGTPGNGHIQWEPIVETLEDIEYADQVVIESFTPEVESIARAAAIWRPLETSQNDLAQDGVEFLDQAFN